MAISVRCLPLIFTFLYVCLSTSSISVLSDTNTGDRLVNEVCKTTKIFDFCRRVIDSDPLSKDADKYTLAYIVFHGAYINANKATDYIDSWIKHKKVGDRDEALVGMKKCLRFYRWAVHSLEEALGNLSSDTYYELDRSAANAGGYARDCEASFSGRSSPMSVQNQDLINYSTVCLAVSKLFPYE